MRKYLTKRNIIVLIVLVVLFGWWRINAARRAAANKTTLKTAVVSRADVIYSLSVSGDIMADKTATLNYPAPGKISYMGVKTGDAVKTGHILASLDLGDLQTAWTRAYYNYLAADANAKQIEDAVKGHDTDESFAQKNQRVAAQTARDEAYDAMLAAQRAINNAQLKAPFDGIVTNITANAVGDTVNVTDGLTIVDPKSLYFSAEVDESDVGKISVNEPVDVTLDAYPGQDFSGKIVNIGFISQISSTGATIFPVKILLTGEDVTGKLRVGMNGDADIILQEKQNVLSLPVEAVTDGKVTLPGKAGREITVETGLEGDTLVEITGGLKEGDTVIIK